MINSVLFGISGNGFLEANEVDAKKEVVTQKPETQVANIKLLRNVDKQGTTRKLRLRTSKDIMCEILFQIISFEHN